MTNIFAIPDRGLIGIRGFLKRFSTEGSIIVAMEALAIARANFDLEARVIENKINGTDTEGSYSWSRSEKGGADYLSVDDKVNGVLLFTAVSSVENYMSKDHTSGESDPIVVDSKEGKDMGSAVQEVIEALSPRSSLRISKEIIKNELSSWIMSIEEEGKEEPNELRGSSDSMVSEVIADNVFQYLDPSRTSIEEGDDGEEEEQEEEGKDSQSRQDAWRANQQNMSMETYPQDLSLRSMTSGSDSRVTLEKGLDDDEESELGFFRLAEENTDDAIEFHRNHIGNDDEDEVNLGEENDDVNLSRSDDDEGNQEDEVADTEAVPGPTLLAVAAVSNVHMEEVRGSVSISLNAVGVDTTAVGSSEPSYSLSVDSQDGGGGGKGTATAVSTDFSVYVSDSDDSSTKRAPVKSLTPQDIQRLEEEEQWLEAAIAERIAFLRR